MDLKMLRRKIVTTYKNYGPKLCIEIFRDQTFDPKYRNQTHNLTELNFLSHKNNGKVLTSFI